VIVGLVMAYDEEGRVGGAVSSLFDIGCARVVVVDGAWTGPDGMFGDKFLSSDRTAEEALHAGAEFVAPPFQAWTDGGKRDWALQRVGLAVGDYVFLLDADERARGSLEGAPEGHGCVVVETTKPNDLPGYRGTFPHGDYGRRVPLLRWLRWSSALRCVKPGRYLEGDKAIRVYRFGPLAGLTPQEACALPVLPGVRIDHAIEADQDRVAAKRRYYQAHE
jgi:hypothetical protein